MHGEPPGVPREGFDPIWRVVVRGESHEPPGDGSAGACGGTLTEVARRIPVGEVSPPPNSKLSRDMMSLPRAHTSRPVGLMLEESDGTEQLFPRGVSTTLSAGSVPLG